MSRTTVGLDPDLREYLLKVSVDETPELRSLREETAGMRNAGMQISPEQGQLLHFLVRLTGTRTAIEVGTFTGYSALWTALALPPDGRLVACDTSVEWTTIGRRYWKLASVDAKIDLHIGPAEKTLRSLIEEGMEGCFDMAFIDADKTGYPEYYELCMELLRQGGLLALDNVFRGGRVASPGETDPGTTAIRELNETIHRDARVDSCMVPVSDGLILARKR